ncbi:MAG: hypothetical protein ACREKL_06315 [Chthoniobacterales bacterium]
MIKPFATACAFASLLFQAPLARAGDKAAPQDDATAPWSASLSTGWDSLYMFRGVNQLPGYKGYGSSISWTALSLTANLTPQDFLTINSWAAFGIGESDYKEVDGNFAYTHAIGDLSLTLGYSLFAVLDAPGGLYSHELSVAAAYELNFGPVKITPGVGYTFTLGPDAEHGGYIPANVGYLELRVDGEAPVYRDVVSLAPWIATGFSFGYNTTEAGADETNPFTGADHIECGAALNFSLSVSVTISPYVSYSHAWVQLAGTRANTVWGGVSVEISF